jgi:methyl-accepting chemotaxis protein
MSETIAETAATVKDVTGKVSQAARDGYKKTMEELKSEAEELTGELEGALDDIDENRA